MKKNWFGAKDFSRFSFTQNSTAIFVLTEKVKTKLHGTANIRANMYRFVCECVCCCDGGVNLKFYTFIIYIFVQL